MPAYLCFILREVEESEKGPTANKGQVWNPSLRSCQSPASPMKHNSQRNHRVHLSQVCSAALHEGCREETAELTLGHRYQRCTYPTSQHELRGKRVTSSSCISIKIPRSQALVLNTVYINSFYSYDSPTRQVL